MSRARATDRDRLVEYLKKRIEKEHSSRVWKWRDGWFVGGFCSVINHISLYARFEVQGRELRAVIESKGRYGIEDKESETFDSVEGIGECARWTAERLAELYDTVTERAATYLTMYEQALRGVL